MAPLGDRHLSMSRDTPSGFTCDAKRHFKVLMMTCHMSEEIVSSTIDYIKKYI